MPFIGLHIHKTAGTSLLRYLEKHATSRLYGAYSLRNYRLIELPLWASANLTSRDIFWGHAIYESFFYDIVDPIKLFTFLREPSERIVSWYNMLKRRNKLKKSAVDLYTFASAHNNSICRMLIARFPSLVEDDTAPQAYQAMQILEKMGFVGFQCHFTDHIIQLLDWMGVPIFRDSLIERHNTGRQESKTMLKSLEVLRQLNDQDYHLYNMAYKRYGSQPINHERHILMSSIKSINKESIRHRQVKSAQKKFLSSLRFSIGDAGVESYVKLLNSRFESCENSLNNVLTRSYNAVQDNIESEN